MLWHTCLAVGIDKVEHSIRYSMTDLLSVLLESIPGSKAHNNMTGNDVVRVLKSL